MYNVLKEKTILDDELIIQEAEIRNDDDQTIKKLRVKHQNTAAVLLFNTETHRFILTNQFRYPIASQVGENIPEIIAGKMDDGEDPADTAVRETEEETGYRILRQQLRSLGSFFMSPGYTSERLYLYFASVVNENRISEGGGKKDEHEDVHITELSYHEFTTMLRTGKINDAKTCLAGLLLDLPKHL